MNGMLAIIKDIAIQMDALIHNPFVVGFFIGLLLALLISAFLITEHPTHLPLILIHNHCKSYEKIEKRKGKEPTIDGLCEFAHIYYTTRNLVLVVVALFCMAVIGAMIFG